MRAGTYTDNEMLFVLPRHPRYTVFLPRSMDEGAFKIDSTGNFCVNGTLTLAADMYAFFNISFAL